ncbi:MAG: hypothetical protein AAF654_06705 [Myxococcota bacterium]
MICAIDGGLAYHTRTLREPPFNQYFDRLIDLRTLGDVDLSRENVLLIPCRTNGQRLQPHRRELARFVDRGGLLVVFGETHPQLFLDGVEFTREPTNYWWWLDPAADLGVRVNGPEHPLVSSLSIDDISWHVHGTLRLQGASHSLIEWRHPERGGSVMETQTRGEGELVITTLDPIYHHGSGFMPATTRFLSQFLPALNEYARLRG